MEVDDDDDVDDSEDVLEDVLLSDLLLSDELLVELDSDVLLLSLSLSLLPFLLDLLA